MSGGRRVVAGVGNRFRSDDGAGVEVAELVRSHAPRDTEILALEGEPTRLIDHFDTAALVILVDAAALPGAPGQIRRFDATVEPLPVEVFGASTHAFGLAETIEIARALGKLHARIIVYAITGEQFGAGEGLTPPVSRAVRQIAGEILEDLTDVDSHTSLKGATRA